MRELLTHDGGGRAEARQHRHGEGGPDGQTVDEVVQGVTQSYHPRHRLDAGHAFAAQPVAHHGRRGIVLKEWADHRRVHGVWVCQVWEMFFPDGTATFAKEESLNLNYKGVIVVCGKPES